jgi:hypothetical protein
VAHCWSGSGGYLATECVLIAGEDHTAMLLPGLHTDSTPRWRAWRSRGGSADPVCCVRGHLHAVPLSLTGRRSTLASSCASNAGELQHLCTGWLYLLLPPSGSAPSHHPAL